MEDDENLKNEMKQTMILPYCDKYSSPLISQIPLGFSFFKFLGFMITKDGLHPVRQLGRCIEVVISIFKGDQEICRQVAKQHFRGVIYFTNIDIKEEGTYCITVQATIDKFHAIKSYDFQFVIQKNFKLEDCQGIKKLKDYELMQVAQDIPFHLMYDAKNHPKIVSFDDIQKYLHSLQFQHNYTSTKLKKFFSIFLKRHNDYYKKYPSCHLETPNEFSHPKRKSVLSTYRRSKHPRKLDVPEKLASAKEHSSYFEMNLEKRQVLFNSKKNSEKKSIPVRYCHRELFGDNDTVVVYSKSQMYEELRMYIS